MLKLGPMSSERSTLYSTSDNLVLTIIDVM